MRHLLLPLLAAFFLGTHTCRAEDPVDAVVPSAPTGAPIPHPALGPTEATRRATDQAAAADPAPPAPGNTEGQSPIPVEEATATPLPKGGPLPLPPGETPLSLTDCFRMAAIRSDTLKINAQDVLIAKTQWSQAVAGLYPNVILSGNSAFQNQTRGVSSNPSDFSRIPINANSGPIVSEPVFPNNRDYVSALGITATQTIFNGGRNYQSIGAAQQTIEAKKERLRYAYQTLYQDVASAFYQTLADAGEAVLLEDLTRDLDARAKELDRRVKLNRSRPSEWMQARADLASANVDLERRKALVNVDREMMAYYLGIPAKKIYLCDKGSLPPADDIEAYLRSLDYRPDILSQNAAIRVAERDLSGAKGRFLPTVDARFDWTPMSAPSGTQEWVATFTASLPVFDGGLIIAQVNEQREILRQSRLDFESLQRTADEQVRAAFASFNGSAAEYLQNRQYAEFAALSLNAQIDEYLHGATSNLNVLAALHSYHMAREQLHLSDIDARLGFIKLHVAAGNAPTETPAGAAASTGR